MDKLKHILIDGFILFLASTVFVLIADYGFSFLKDKGVKDDPIVTAISQGKIDILRTLAESGKQDMAQLDSHERTALMRAGYANYNSSERTAEADAKRAPMIPLLVENGAPLDQQDSHGWSALMWASWSGMPEVTAQLLQANSSTTAIGKQGNSALTLAAMRGNAATVDLLLEAGADTSVKTKKGETALDLAKAGIKEYPDKKAGYDAIIAALDGK